MSLARLSPLYVRPAGWPWSQAWKTQKKKTEVTSQKSEVRSPHSPVAAILAPVFCLLTSDFFLEVIHMLHHILIGDNERVLVIRKRRFVEILGPGERWMFGRGIQLLPHNVCDLIFAGE